MLKPLAKILPCIALAGGLPAIGMTKSPTIVLVHGAFADSRRWLAVITQLEAAGFPVIVSANSLRGVADDTASVAALLLTITGPVVLVAHSYGGVRITNAARDNPSVKALVYVVGFAPEATESSRLATIHRPKTAAVLGGPSGVSGWESLPIWFIYCDADLCIPQSASASLADRDGCNQLAVIAGGSHSLMESHPAEVVAVIEAAAVTV
jgi:pimeloyl-ACP methyl ester carboxylesterase